MFALLENIIRFHIEAVIAALIGLVCLIAGIVLYNSAFRKPEDADHEGDLRRIEEAIEKLLQQNKSTRVAAPATGASGETLGIAEGDEHVQGNPIGAQASGDVQVQLDLLAAELESKKKEIEGLRKAADQDTKTPELLAKIKNLEDRLAEYEIIEDDIADLSKYKEENARLKRQLESLATGGAAADEEIFAISADQKDMTPEEAVSAADESTMAEQVEDLGAETFGELAAEPTPEPTTPEQDELAAKAAELAKELGELDAEPVAEAPVASETPVAETAEAGPTTNMLAELTDAEESEQTEDPLAALGDIDTSKMLEEIQGLSDQAAALELDDVPDVNKIADEADNKEEER